MNLSRSFLISLIVLFICSLPLASFGILQNQENGTSLKELLQQWQTLDGKISAKEVELNSTTPKSSEPSDPAATDPQNREKLIAEYTELLTLSLIHI